jgi:RNA polymerase sporulation-specific sigma factor
MQEEEIVDLARCGHPAATEFLMTRFRPLVENKAKAYFLMGADREDVIQEGMIGLYKAIRDFRSDRLNRFRPFAELCVTRQIITAVKTATRQKHVPLNGYVSLNRSYQGDNPDITLIDVIPNSSTGNPEAEILGTGKIAGGLNESLLNALSELERNVLDCYLDGLTYREMSDKLSCHSKSIDNALQRIKRKIGVILKV